MVENKERRKNGDKKERNEIKEKGEEVKREKIKEKEDKNRVDVRNRDMIG